MTDEHGDSPQPTSSASPGVLLRELVKAEHDVLSLGEAHRLTLDELSTWASEPQTQRTVAGLCLLADLQTQLLLSRYRLVAATRLVGQATGQDEGLSPEQVRKACVDLLKIELDRVASVSLDASQDKDDPALEELKRAMLGEAGEAEGSAVVMEDRKTGSECPHAEG